MRFASGKNACSVSHTSGSVETCVAAKRGCAFFGCMAPAVHLFLMEEAAAVDINVFKDILWDLMNESDALDVTDIQSIDKDNRFIVTVSDGSSFDVQVSATGK